MLGPLLSACSPPPIEWDDPVLLPAELASAERVGFDSVNRLVALPALSIAVPDLPRQCASSVRVARDTNGDWYAVWWSRRADSTADIVVARSADGATWAPPVKVDSMDTARVGCRRPPPSIDASGGNVHVAYSMAAKEGRGIFASHSMDRGTMFHSPVAVVYGERIGETAIAANGDDVVVAYEDPNSTLDHVGLALSRTMAHLFQSRHTASPSAGVARKPRLALGGGRVAVMWTRESGDTSTRMMRIGVLR